MKASVLIPAKKKVKQSLKAFKKSRDEGHQIITWCLLTDDNKILGILLVNNLFFQKQHQILSRQKKKKKSQVISTTMAATEIEST